MKPRRAAHKHAAARAAETKALALEAIDRFARVLALTGMSREQMAYAFHEASAKVPKSLLKSGQTLERELVDTAHVLTLWLSDPNYLDKTGEPLRIPSRGGPPSLDALIQRVNPEVGLDQVVNYLTRTGSVIKVGRRYAVKNRGMSFEGDPELAYTHGLQAVLGMLRTIENNALPKKNARVWFESFAENPRFPARLQGEFDARLRRLGIDFLKRLDGDMQRAEQLRQPGERTVRMAVGLYQCEGEGHRMAGRTAHKPTRKGRYR
jgi:hypothetical protein